MISRLIRKLQHRLSCIAGWTENMEEKKYKAIIEGILFSMGESVELEKIAGTLGLDQKKTKELIDEMRNEWEEQKRGVTITELDGAYQMCTRPEIYEYLIKIAKQPKRRVLTDVLLETLSIIAYKQPVTFFRRQAFPQEFPKESSGNLFPLCFVLRFRRNIPYGNPPEDIYYLYYIIYYY